MIIHLFTTKKIIYKYINIDFYFINVYVWIIQKLQRGIEETRF